MGLSSFMTHTWEQANKVFLLNLFAVIGKDFTVNFISVCLDVREFLWNLKIYPDGCSILVPVQMLESIAFGSSNETDDGDLYVVIFTDVFCVCYF
jgi:hypothetical protein